MTSDENPADTAIEQFIAEEFAFQPASEIPLQAQRLRVKLDDAGLLADPADRGFDGANEAFTWRERALHWKADKERAEAERDELRADYAALVNSQLLTRYGELGTRLVRAEADLAALRNRIGSIAGVLRCVDAPAASMIQDALDGGDPK